METTCPKCGGEMRPGVAGANGLFRNMHTPEEPQLTFAVLGTHTSANPLKAFAQGLSDEPATQPFLIRGVRCARCGFLELYATERTIGSGSKETAGAPS